jgi:multisubunit Na+/H+ antiporter MnhB subunit
MAQQSKRERLRTQRKKQRRVRTIIWGGVGVIIVVLAGITSPTA